MELSPNVKRYIKLSKKIDEVSDMEQDEIYEKLEELYYKLSDEEIDFLELKGYC